MDNNDLELLQQQIQKESSTIDELRNYTAQRIIGQEKVIDRLLVGLLGRGHVLLEGLPGLAKTLAINTLAHGVGGTFSRIQFTPDLLPADVIGTMIYNPGTQSFDVRKGPIFANFVLADEINRAPAKVQSALLEAMQEKQVTIGKKTYGLDQPFLVLATQNPIEQEGTYPLPEAQTDRFMLKVAVGYPSKEEERQVIRLNLGQDSFEPMDAIMEPSRILNLRKLVDKIYMDEKIEQYILDLIFASRYPDQYNLPKLVPMIRYGGSPRASINLAKASKCMAFLNHRAFVTPEDVRSIAKDILRHRIGLTYEAEAEEITTEDIVDQLVQTVAIP